MCIYVCVYIYIYIYIYIYKYIYIYIYIYQKPWVFCARTSTWYSVSGSKPASLLGIDFDGFSTEISMDFDCWPSSRTAGPPGIHQRGVQWEGGAVDGGSIISVIEYPYGWMGGAVAREPAAL